MPSDPSEYQRKPRKKSSSVPGSSEEAALEYEASRPKVAIVIGDEIIEERPLDDPRLQGISAAILRGMGDERRRNYNAGRIGDALKSGGLPRPEGRPDALETNIGPVPRDIGDLGAGLTGAAVEGAFNPFPDAFQPYPELDRGLTGAAIQGSADAFSAIADKAGENNRRNRASLDRSLEFADEALDEVEGYLTDEQIERAAGRLHQERQRNLDFSSFAQPADPDPIAASFARAASLRRR